MKHILIIMIAAVLILSAFNITIPEYGLYYEIVVEKMFDTVGGWIEAGSYIFSGSDGILNSLFGITDIPDITLTSDSVLRLLQYEDSYIVEVCYFPDIEIPGSGTEDKTVYICCSNIPDLYYVKATSNYDAYKIFNVRDEVFWEIDSNTITFSDTYDYFDFITFLQENHPSISDDIIEEMESFYVGG